MQSVKRIAAVIGIGLALAGCASGPSYTEASKNIPVLADGQGRIYLYRATTLGTAVQPVIRLNGEEVGKAVPRGFFYADRPAGTYEISASTEATRDLSLTLDPGEEKYVRLEMKMGFMVGQVKPVLVEPAVGREEIQKTSYIGK